jgi:hypothetical protein
MMRYFLTACAIAWGLPAFANPQCADHDDLATALADQYGEQQRFIGIDTGGNLLEMWVSPGGSWTALLTQPGGQTCVVAAGNAGNIIAFAPQGVDG